MFEHVPFIKEAYFAGGGLVDEYHYDIEDLSNKIEQIYKYHTTQI